MAGCRATVLALEGDDGQDDPADEARVEGDQLGVPEPRVVPVVPERASPRGEAPRGGGRPRAGCSGGQGLLDWEGGG